MSNWTSTKALVWIGYQCDCVGYDVSRSVVKVFDDEVKALAWKEEFVATDTDWRDVMLLELE
jgi:hypothetical protein